MKTIRTVFATVAIGASLTLAACSTGEPGAPQEGNGQGQEQGQDQGQGSGEDQAQNSAYTKEQVEKAFKDAGYELQANAQPPTMKNLDQAKIEPAECKGVLLNQVQRIDETTSDKTIVGTKGQEAAASGVVYGSEDEAKKRTGELQRRHKQVLHHHHGRGWPKAHRYNGDKRRFSRRC